MSTSTWRSLGRELVGIARDEIVDQPIRWLQLAMRVGSRIKHLGGWIQRVGEGINVRSSDALRKRLPRLERDVREREASIMEGREQ